MLNKNNEAYKYAEKNVKHIIKDIKENGEIGITGQRIIDRICSLVIKNNFYFNQMGSRLKGTGASANVIRYMTRKGWHARGRDDNDDFKGMQRPNALNEILVRNLLIETEMMFSKLDLKDVEGNIGDLIKSQMMSALTTELPIVYEKRVLNKIFDAGKNGVQLVSDHASYDTGKIAYPKLQAISYDTDDNTKAAVDLMVKLHNNQAKKDNPIIYKKPKGNWYWVFNLDLDAAIQRLGIYGTYAAASNDYQNFLNNKEVRMFNGSPVFIDSTLPDHIPFLLLPKNGEFGNIEWIYTDLPSDWLSRADFSGSSAENMFYKINSTAFSFNISYWATKIGLWAMGTNATGLVDNLSAGMKTTDINVGDLEIIYTINGIGSSTAADFEIYLEDDQFEETLLTDSTGTAKPAVVIDGTDTTLDKNSSGLDTILGGLATGSYNVSIRDKDGVVLYRTETFMHRNKAYVEAQTGSIVNKKQKAPKAINMNNKKEVEKLFEEEMAEIKKRKAEALNNIKKVETKPKAEKIDKQKEKAEEKARKAEEAKAKAEEALALAEARAKELEAKYKKEQEDKAKKDLDRKSVV